MIKETTQLSSKIAQLEAVAINQDCSDCSLMSSYVKNEYYHLRSKFEAIERLVKSNFSQQKSHNITEIKRSVSILGLYALV